MSNNAFENGRAKSRAPLNATVRNLLMPRKIHRLVLAVFVAILVMGCASTTLERKNLQSYSVGSIATARTGDTFLVDQNGSVETVKSWVGILNSPNGWKIEERYSRDFVRKELLYSGKSGSTIEVSYREFRGGFAAPAFFQNLKYDLAESNVIQFQKFRIEIINADNQKITYKILND